MFQLLRTRRPFVAEITDAMGNEIFKVTFLQANLTLLEIYLIVLSGLGSQAILVDQQLNLCRSRW
jgi:hypothetical protein